MNRAEYRRIEKEQLKPSKVYTLNQAQINQIKEKAVEEATNKAFVLMMAIPCEILANEGYWEKTAKQRMPKFLDDCIGLFKAYEQGVVTMEQMQSDLKKIGGIEVQI
ncbi:MAG: hypothetical protein K0R92_438 [Lachnospiraceae bacterium]|jgi:hypothetical protein|nr:hypothetical protein [Lachnospiraceae bacterium]